MIYKGDLVNFELLFRDIRNLDILSNEDLDFLKANIKESTLSSYQTYNNKVSQNLSKYEFIALGVSRISIFVRSVRHNDPRRLGGGGVLLMTF